MDQPDDKNTDGSDRPRIEKLWSNFARSNFAKAVAASIILSLVGFGLLFTVIYHRVSKRVDRVLEAKPFLHSFSYFAAPEVLSVGDPAPGPEIIAALKRSGATFNASGARSALRFGSAEIQFASGKISSIVNLTDGRRLAQIEIPAQPVSDVSDDGRAKRLMLRYSELPPSLVHAIISAEDKRFFEHSGIDVLRIAKASYVDLRDHRKQQGASTISMQLARTLWLDQDKRWKRKMTEALIAVHLEHKLTKEQIFEDYCNLVYLGSEGAFGINGFGEAARAYFNKDVRQLNLTEAATLAGLIQRPSYLNPFYHPDRALARRNAVLLRMRDNKYITPAQYQAAAIKPLELRQGARELSEAQYFLDIAAREASKEIDEQAASSAHVYTTLDLRLQHEAEQSIADGMQLVDKLLAARRKPGQPAGPKPQVALIAIDPHTGEVRALCGGREYAASQFDRVLSKRPPGSVFKPFVYAAALNTAVAGGNRVLTEASTVDDSPATFEFGNQTYSPNNFKGEFRGIVTLRQALAHSLNVATVKVGEMVGFDQVAHLARMAGLNDQIKATPAIALGAYQATPLEIAGAYTIFANEGRLVPPAFVSEIRDSGDANLYRRQIATRPVLDSRVAFLMLDMLQEVMRSGTAAGVRSRGFTLPAAGKTGTSHDGWFAGFTSRLLCVVWVGFDDYSELNLEGARSALPIWTEFMTLASRYKQYGDVKPFAAPPGVVQVEVDPSTGDLAGPDCPGSNVYFISGTQPSTACTPQEIEVTFTPDGGTIQRAVQVQPASNHSLLQDR